MELETFQIGICRSYVFTSLGSKVLSLNLPLDLPLAATFNHLCVIAKHFCEVHRDTEVKTNRIKKADMKSNLRNQIFCDQKYFNYFVNFYNFSHVSNLLYIITNCLVHVTIGIRIW